MSSDPGVPYAFCHSTFPDPSRRTADGARLDHDAPGNPQPDVLERPEK